MHSKNTVKYICETYSSGNQYFYKQELITYDSWDNPNSIMWSTPRPISEKTYKQRKKEGYKTEIRYNKKLPAIIIPFSKSEQTVN